VKTCPTWTYLRDGIHLRQIANTDPLTAWQKEGYLMFEHLLEAVDSDYVRYITHVEAQFEPRPATKVSTFVDQRRAGRSGRDGTSFAPDVS